jgi:hypothetical protein
MNGRRRSLFSLSSDGPRVKFAAINSMVQTTYLYVPAARKVTIYALYNPKRTPKSVVTAHLWDKPSHAFSCTSQRCLAPAVLFPHTHAHERSILVQLCRVMVPRVKGPPPSELQSLHWWCSSNLGWITLETNGQSGRKDRANMPILTRRRSAD